MRAAVSEGKKVVIPGAGGNIGSHLCGLVARCELVGHVVVVDRDHYETKNLSSQDIRAGDVGQWKAEVQAEAMRAVRPGLTVEALCRDISDVPLGLLRCDLMLTALDSMVSRQVVNSLVFRLGIPWWIDSGVDTAGRLARITVYRPGPDLPCLECTWGPDNYAAMARASCADGTAPTDGIAALGALAASLQALEARRILSTDEPPAAAGWELLVSAGDHTQVTSVSRRNVDCLFDHRAWEIVPLNARPEDMKLADVFGMAPDGSAPDFAVANKRFVTCLQCPGCGQSREVLCLEGRMDSQEDCDCGGRMVPLGFGLREWLSRANTPEAILGLSLWDVGMRSADVVMLRDADRTMYYELG